jgi:subtilisin family serine protease
MSWRHSVVPPGGLVRGLAVVACLMGSAVSAAAPPLVSPAAVTPMPISRPMQAQNQIVSSNSGSTIFNGFSINTRVGADAFYAAGYTGSSAIMANIEAGHVWNGHETLNHVNTFISGPGTLAATNGVSAAYDRHATWVAQAMGGRTTTGGGEYQRGIAFGATLWSGSIATSWNLTSGSYSISFNINSFNAFFQPYVTATKTGIDGQTADVVNSSWGSTGTGVSSGRQVFAWSMDALARDTAKIFVFSAGNSGPGENTVRAPATAYNVISVGAVGSDTSNPTYNTVSGFSSRGPNDAFVPDSATGTTGTIIANARVRVDIVAPGQNLTLAYYGGATGGNEGNTPNGGPASYSGNMQGTSFAAPIVAAGAALLVDAGRQLQLPNSADARVVKAVLLNSADKTAGWNNGQTLSNGVITTTQALDVNVGAGRMNLAQALPYYHDPNSTRDVPGTNQGHLGTVALRGYDFGLVNEGSFNSYTIAGTHPGAHLTVTLTWFIDRAIDSFSNPTTLFEVALANLNVEVWSVVDGIFTTLLARSDSTYNNTEHLYLQDLPEGQYGLRVNYLGDLWDFTNSLRAEHYALAWHLTPVPEPGFVIGLLALVLAAAWVVRRPYTVFASGRGS